MKKLLGAIAGLVAWVASFPALADPRYSDHLRDEPAAGSGFVVVVVLLAATMAWSAIRHGFKRSRIQGVLASGGVAGLTIAGLAYPMIGAGLLLLLALAVFVGLIREAL